MLSRRLALTPLKTGKPLKAHAAQQRVWDAIKRGELRKPDRCERCGVQTDRLEFAHHDYGPGIRGEWLCISCHRKEDRARPKGGRMRGFSGRE